MATGGQVALWKNMISGSATCTTGGTCGISNVTIYAEISLNMLIFVATHTKYLINTKIVLEK